MELHIEKKIYYHDTDSGGVVYYANYLKYLEEGRYEYCLKKGVDLAIYITKGTVFPVVHIEVDYTSPARYADTIRVYTRLEKIGNSSIRFIQEIRKDTTTLVKAKTIWACIGNDFKLKAVPEEIKQALTSA
ncbi:MAG: thioesterase family protein [Candidatus Omnitrophota bacterium]